MGLFVRRIAIDNKNFKQETILCFGTGGEIRILYSYRANAKSKRHLVVVWTVDSSNGLASDHGRLKSSVAPDAKFGGNVRSKRVFVLLSSL